MGILAEKRVWRREPIEKQHKPRSLTLGEQAHLGHALDFLSIRYGSLRGLAHALRMTYDALRMAARSKRSPTMVLAMHVAYVADASVGQILSGAGRRRERVRGAGARTVRLSL